MTRGPRLAAHEQGEPMPTSIRGDRFMEQPAPLDLGIALSIYRKDRAGRLIALDETAAARGDASAELADWLTEQ